MAYATGVAADQFAIHERRRRSRLRVFARLCRRKPLGALGGAIVVVMICMALITVTPLQYLFIPYDYDAQDYYRILESPSDLHPLGTDGLGRDVLSRVMYGARVSVLVGFAAVALAQGIALFAGVVSGFYGGRLDAVVQRFVDIWMSFPGLLFILTVMTIVGAGVPQLIFAIGVRFAAQAARTNRSAVIAVRGNAYIEAARVVGAGDARIIARYVLPNIFPVLITIATAEVGFAILLEATVSFLGYAIPPPFPTWGQMLTLDAISNLQHAPWLSLAPGLAITLTVFGFNMLGDALRDLLDPRLRNSG